MLRFNCYYYLLFCFPTNMHLVVVVPGRRTRWQKLYIIENIIEQTERELLRKLGFKLNEWNNI